MGEEKFVFKSKNGFIFECDSPDLLTPVIVEFHLDTATDIIEATENQNKMYIEAVTELILHHLCKYRNDIPDFIGYRNIVFQLAEDVNETKFNKSN